MKNVTLEFEQGRLVALRGSCKAKEFREQMILLREAMS